MFKSILNLFFKTCCCCFGAIGSVVGDDSRAEAAADEGNHEDTASDPEVESHGEIVVHGPSETIESVCQRSSANTVVPGEHHGSNDDVEDHLNEASNQGAVDGADSPSVSPGTDEHEERVKSDNSEGSSHEGCNYGELGATFLAIHVTVICKILKSLKELSCHFFVIVVDGTINLQLYVPSIATEGPITVCRCG